MEQSYEEKHSPVQDNKIAIKDVCASPLSQVGLGQGDQIGQFFTNWATFGGSL